MIPNQVGVNTNRKFSQFKQPNSIPYSDENGSLNDWLPEFPQQTVSIYTKSKKIDVSEENTIIDLENDVTIYKVIISSSVNFTFNKNTLTNINNNAIQFRMIIENTSTANIEVNFEDTIGNNKIEATQPTNYVYDFISFDYGNTFLGIKITEI